MIPSNIMFIHPVTHTALSALSGFFAPRFCPTSVEAALLIPHDGKIVNPIILIAIV